MDLKIIEKQIREIEGSQEEMTLKMEKEELMRQYEEQDKLQNAMQHRQAVSDKNTERTQTAEVDTGYNHPLVTDNYGEIQYGNVRGSLKKYATNNTVTERQSQESQSIQKSPMITKEHEASFHVDNFEMLIDEGNMKKKQKLPKIGKKTARSPRNQEYDGVKFQKKATPLTMKQKMQNETFTRKRKTQSTFANQKQLNIKMDAHIKNYGPQHDKTQKAQSPSTPKTGRITTD